VCYCSPFEPVNTTEQFSNTHLPAYTEQTSAPLYANDAIANSGTLYEEISTDHGDGTMHVMVRALYDYQAVEDDELSLTAGKTYIVSHAYTVVVDVAVDLVIDKLFCRYFDTFAMVFAVVICCWHYVVT